MKSKKMDIIYEDKDLLVVNKPAGLLCVGTDKEKIRTLYHEAYEYVHKKNKNNRIFIVHRLDRDTSGLVLFAKSEKLKRYFQDNWNNIAKTRKYYAVVEGCVKNDSGHIQEYLTEDKTLHTYATDKLHGYLAITDYKVLKKSKNYSILEIDIKTGRKNQIRVAMSNLGHPVIGDKKYGSTKNPIRHMCLHHQTLKVLLPNGKEQTFEAKIPSYFSIFK